MMNNSIADLRIIDRQVFHEFEKALGHLRFLLFETEFKSTAEICFMFIGNIDALKDSILNCAEKGDFYSASILYRSINEHYFRFNYFYFNNADCKDDSYAQWFTTSLDLSERWSVQKAYVAARQLKKEKVKSTDQIWDELVKLNSNFKNFTRIEIEEFSRSMSIKNIMRYFERNKIGNHTGNEKFLQHQLIDYAQLSSFVHGGVHAHKNVVDLNTREDREKVILNLFGPALQMATSIKIFSYLAIYQFMPEFGDLYNNTQELMKKIKK